MSTAKGLRPQVLRVPGKSYQAAQSRPLAFLQESLESALMGTHQEMEMFGSQPAYPEKLLHKKESLQNQLINIRVELSQATTVMRGVGGLQLGYALSTPRQESHPSSLFSEGKSRVLSQRDINKDPALPRGGRCASLLIPLNFYLGDWLVPTRDSSRTCDVEGHFFLGLL